jgi:hypothetical protein
MRIEEGGTRIDSEVWGAQLSAPRSSGGNPLGQDHVLCRIKEKTPFLRTGMNPTIS